MRGRDRLLLCAMTAAVLVAAVAHLHADALIAVPALLLLLPLAAGRYVGSERLVRLARRVPRPRLPRGARAAARRRPALRVAPRGGLLIAVSLARRGPPASAAARRPRALRS
jgi:hypothetical protein